MDDTLNRLARELADAIAAAAAADPRVEDCRQQARAAGFDLQVSLEATVGFAPRRPARARAGKTWTSPRRDLEITGTDRRFLRSLRIACDDVAGVQ
jgi:hypothetical protein